ncbi:CocE/NonD family hydrolase [Streptomyces graminilatus]|uniref:CocE/NonD family hydrolase n=1 Tax=Streptomyces graminilatus TaxID=1464070 RepID=UPI000A6E8012|nr:CocE/NonD family hydrolase [Streptomyces graminilatus]
MPPFTYQRIIAGPVPAQARQYMVRMRDGVRLATDVYLPEPPPEVPGGDPAAPTYPTVLVRLPYDKNSRYVFFDRIAARFTARGYAMVVQDVRGKFRSGGRTLPFLSEADDGYDSIEWTTHQPWSNGRVGMFGDSYYGFTQWAAVSSQHPALRAIVPRLTCANFNDLLQHDPRGAAQTGRPVWVEGAEYYAHHWVENDTYEFEVDRSVRPMIEQYEQAFRALGTRSEWFDVIAPNYANLLPAALGRHPYDARPVPVLHCVGWFDNVRVPHMRDYEALASRPGWDAVQYLWAASIDHENYTLDGAPVTAPENDHALDDTALDRMLNDYTGPALDFFDVFLKETRPVSSLRKVSWELGHAGRRTSDVWPPADSTVRTLWLGDPARSADPLPGAPLTHVSPPEEGSVEWAYDPDALVASAVNNSFAYLQAYPDLAETAARSDVLAFTGPVLSEPLDLAGPVGLDLYVTSSAPVFDVFAQLLDLSPDGQARLVVRGEVEVVRETAPEQIHVELGHTGYRLRAGHRLALIITSSDYPLFLPASGTEENRWTTATPKSSTQTLGTGGARPSRLTVTVLPSATSG